MSRSVGRRPLASGWRAATSAAVVTAVAISACSDHEFEPPDPSVRVERAAGSYDPAAFDTLAWVSDALRTAQGNEVYAAECARCHGTLGRGGTDYAAVRDLDVPSLVEPDWPLAQIDSLRRQVHVGHVAGMPSFGARDLTPRDIDAAAAYVLLTLRPEVLGEGQPPSAGR